MSTPDSGAAFEQVYYLGSFDPYGQLEPSLYRVRVEGRSPAMSSMRFASGWVPSVAVDSLGSTLQFGEDGVSFKDSDDLEGDDAPFLEGRKLVLFGPEGFREVPEDHRLVILMDSDPTHFFKAVQDVLGYMRAIESESATLDEDVHRQWLEAKLAAEQDLAALLVDYPKTDNGGPSGTPQGGTQ